MVEVALASAAIDLLTVLIPKIRDLVQSGQITSEQQQQLRDRYLALQDGNHFVGPEWEVRP